MARTSAEADPQLIAFILPSIPESVPIARFRIRAVLSCHRLDEYADDAEAVTSELVTNAIQHVCPDGTETFGVTLARITEPGNRDRHRDGLFATRPVKREPSHRSEQGRGLLIVGELSVRWGWDLADGGKAVYAILAKKASR